MPRMVFRADAGLAIGSGHVMRCLALATEFQEAGWDIGFAATPETFASVARLRTAEFDRVDLKSDWGAQPPEMAERWPGGVDLLVVDHYGLDARFERACRPWAKRILVIDDLADRPHNADLLVDSATGRPEAYEGLVPSGCPILTGPAYALIGSQFRKARAAALTRRRTESIERVLVSFGQVDAGNASAAALAALAEAGFEGQIDLAIGSDAPHLASLRKTATRQLRFNIDSQDMPALMSGADLAIGAGGATAWERCCLGLPSILVEIADNQQKVIAAIAEAEAGVNAGRADVGSAAKIARIFQILAGDRNGRSRMAGQASRLVDGRGIERIIASATGDISLPEGAKARARAAELDDEGWLLDLQRLPATRRFARNPNPPGATEHAEWLKKVLGDPDRILLILEVSGEASGMLRLDRKAAARFEVSIAIAPGFHGRGVGLAGLRLARKRLPGALLEAEILPGNAASIGLFEKAGYIPAGQNVYQSVGDAQTR